jgi:tetratricopeptide (TPR) repeat protein
MKRFLLLIAAIACSTSLFAQEDKPDLLYFAQEKHGLGQMEEALELVNEHLNNSPDHCEALATRATIYVSLGQNDRALEDVNKALALWKAEDPIYRSLLHWWRADIYKQMGMREAAIEDYTKANELCIFVKILCNRLVVHNRSAADTNLRVSFLFHNDLHSAASRHKFIVNISADRIYSVLALHLNFTAKNPCCK